MTADRNVPKAVGLGALGAAALLAAPAAAQNVAPIKVAVIDVLPSRLDCDDTGVTMIDLSSPPPEGMRHDVAHAGGTTHGVIVATSFVNEARRIEPKVPIEIYTINPFIKDGRGGRPVFSMRMLKEGLERLKQYDVKVAVTTFAVAGKEAGTRIAQAFLDAGLITFAAAPNEPKDPGIYPAVVPGVIAIAEGRSQSPIHKDPSYTTFVKFVIDGEYQGRSATVAGSSFATPRAAAYASFMVRADPTTRSSDVEGAFDRLGHSYGALPAGLKRIGTDQMLKSFRTEFAQTPPGNLPEPGRPSRSITAAAMTAAALRGR